MEATRNSNFPQTAPSGAIFQPGFLTFRNLGIYKPQEPEEPCQDPLTETQDFLGSLVTTLP